MKNLIAAILAGLVVTTTVVGAAAPLELSGTANIKYESDSADNTSTESGAMYTFTLKGVQKIGPNLSLYARLGAQYASNPSLGDFNRDTYGQDTKGVFAIDQFGLIYKPDKLTFTLGRQEAVIGTTALLYKRSEENIGKDAFVDGLSVSGNIGAVSIWGIAAKENNAWLNNNSLYALRGGIDLSKNTNVGLTWGQYLYNGADTTNHWAIDATITFGKSTLIGEYTQSDRSSDNHAYAATWNYDFNGKTAIYITNFRAEANGDMGGQGEFDANNRGFYYGVTHAFNDHTSMEVTYKDQVSLADNSKNSKIEVWLKNKF
jgi:hypothetical protein